MKIENSVYSLGLSTIGSEVTPLPMGSTSGAGGVTCSMVWSDAGCSARPASVTEAQPVAIIIATVQVRASIFLDSFSMRVLGLDLMILANCV